MKMRMVSLGDVADFLTGFPFKSKDYSQDGSGIRLLRGDNIGQGFLRWDGAKLWPHHSAEDYDKFKLKPGDVVLAMDRPWIEAGLKYSVVNDADLPALLVQRVTRLRGTESLNTGYLRYLIGSQEFTEHVHTVSTGTAVPHISGRDILAFEFELPEVEAQKEIARILGALDDKIQLNRRMSATLEEMARALYRSWFVDFDPVHARALGQPPAHMDAATAALFPDSFDLNGLPKGWERKRLGDLVVLNYGKALKKELREPGPYPVYGSGGTDTTHAQALVKHPTIIVGRKGTVGSVMWEPRGCWPIDTTFYVTAEIPMSFVLNALQQLPLADMNTDAAVPGLNRENAYRLEVAFPEVSILKAFDRVAADWRAKIDQAAVENRTLATIRDALLPRLMSGELRIREAEKQVEEVA